MAAVGRVVGRRGHVNDLVVGLVRVLVLCSLLAAVLVLGRLRRGRGRGGGVGVGAGRGRHGQRRLAGREGRGLRERSVARLRVEVDAVPDAVPLLRLEVAAGAAGLALVAQVAIAGELGRHVDADVVGRGVEAADAAVGAVELFFF